MLTTATSEGSLRNILIVEDDEATAEVVSMLLETAGYTPITVADGETALERIHTSQPDLVLLDMRLPGMDGIDVLKQIRQQSSLPLIVMSGYTGGSEKVHAFEQGADDFVAKPFAGEELVARVGALLRRVDLTPPPDTRIVVRHLELDITRRQAFIRGKKLHLTPIEYGILLGLMKTPGKTITHEELIHTVWGDEYVGDYSVLRVNISRLRQKLEENPRHPTYIVTVAGQGYAMPVRRP